MPRLEVPADRDPLAFVWGELAPALSVPAAAYSAAVYERSTLAVTEFEAARLTVARVNDCAICLGWRSARDVPALGLEPDAVPEAFYDLVLAEPDSEDLTERERLAAEFAGRFATAHTAMDDALWARLRRAYTDAELVDLGLCVAAWLALGRFNRVFDLDGGCRAHPVR